MPTQKSFIVQDAGRQLLSGSFNPIDEPTWEDAAYGYPSVRSDF